MDINTPLDQLFPSKWLKAKDLTDAGLHQITARVDKVTVETVKPQPNEEVQRMALWLHGFKPYLITSKADATTLAEAYQVTTASQLVGRPIAIKLDVWRGKAVLRIAPPPPATTTPKAKPPATTAATTPPPVATTSTPPARGGGQAATDAPPVAPPPAATSDAVNLWPPREPWVARKAKTGEVDWVSSFWAGSAALRIPREAARSILEGEGGSFEDACQTMWDEHLAKDRDDDAADAAYRDSF